MAAWQYGLVVCPGYQHRGCGNVRRKKEDGMTATAPMLLLLLLHVSRAIGRR